MMTTRSTLLLSLAASLLFASPALGSPEAIQKATDALEIGGAEQAFFALEDAPPEDDNEKTAYAELLVRATELLLDAEDPVFALQLAKKALSHDASRLDARVLCLQAALEASSFDEAGVQMLALEKARPKDPEIVLWRARLSAADAEWEQARLAAEQVIAFPAATGDQKAEAATLARRAEVAIEGEAKKLAALKALEEEEAAAAAKAKSSPEKPAPAKAKPASP